MYLHIHIYCGNGEFGKSVKERIAFPNALTIKGLREKHLSTVICELHFFLFNAVK